ncbi:hypothetical protein [Mycobacterium sp. NPDC006124]|uniref:PD-(D/E)XK nuclease domain-containing protein n=1 Tax=Mycobacterium sp. NPDC006124 TaxID=3156729 RepID=UPI0033ABD6CF
MPDDVTSQLAQCLRSASALLDAMDATMRDSSPSDIWRYSSFGTFARKYNQVVELANSIEPIAAPVDTFNLERMPSSTNTLAMQQQELFEAVRANLHILKAYLTDRVGLRSDLVIEIADFLQASLRRAVLKTPERERDVQDTVETLLIGRGLEKGTDYDREVGRVKVSSKETIPDFVLAPLKLAIEVKLLRDTASVSRVVDEINADILGYGKFYESIVFVVYDLGNIRDELEFRRDLESAMGVRVVVVKH